MKTGGARLRSVGIYGIWSKKSLDKSYKRNNSKIKTKSNKTGVRFVPHAKIVCVFEDRSEVCIWMKYVYSTNV